MGLDLVGRRHDFRCLEQNLQILNTEVRDANGFHFTLMTVKEDVFHLGPSLVECWTKVLLVFVTEAFSLTKVALRRGETLRPVQEPQVDVIDVELVERVFELFDDIVDSSGSKLGCDEEVGTRDVGSTNGLTYVSFVSVASGSVEMTISSLVDSADEDGNEFFVKSLSRAPCQRPMPTEGILAPC